ncbi:MAG: energy-coupling factor transporter transmembrane protein EcfT [Chloroflexi bacterium]|nr:energy-coupling factor transporter transmembrane protein EcfT [Chloroflexota bacterium]MCL5274147.1 energy-coupling factor transporter transmembrane protein EcfT [Chloroflexota bacterium]
MAITAEAPGGARAAKMRKTLLGYVPIESPFYRYHPVTRLVLFVFIGVVPIFIDMPEINFALVVLTILLLLWGKADLKRLRIYMPMIVTIAIFMFLVVFLAPGNDPTYTPVRIGPATIYYQPVFFTFASYWRLMAMLFGTILYFSTNRERDMLVALRSLKLPFIASYVVGFSIRAAGMFMEDFSTIREAEQARGLDKSALKLADQVKLYVMYLVPLFSIALRRADEISHALFARGYNFTGKVGRGDKRSDYILTKYTMTKADWAWVTGLVLAFVAAAVAEYGYGGFRLVHSPINILLRQALGIG